MRRATPVQVKVRTTLLVTCFCCELKKEESVFMSFLVVIKTNLKLIIQKLNFLMFYEVCFIVGGNLVDNQKVLI